MIPRFIDQVPAGAKRLILAALALAILGAVWPKRAPRHESEGPREVLRSELILRAGHLCRAGDSNAFSGLMIERYSDGALRSRSMICEGLLHGVSEGWFTNRQLQVTEYFKHVFISVILSTFDHVRNNELRGESIKLALVSAHQ